MEERSPFGFEDLAVYRKARELRGKAYALAGRLPDCEKYGLAQQLRRAAVSVTNNIAEGHGRYSWQDNTKFCRTSRGSVCEIVDDLNTSEDRNYADKPSLDEIRKVAAETMKLLNGYITYLQKQKTGD
ncbi:MAG: four helix bundle protein [Planctomycetaceae bacterium]|nr:four helix bundle protein [Planctomycetaceae bacterium]